jgi:hypothetical protein
MVEIEIVATAGTGAMQTFELESIWPVNLVSGNTPSSLMTCQAAICKNYEQLRVSSSGLRARRKLAGLD